MNRVWNSFVGGVPTIRTDGEITPHNDVSITGQFYAICLGAFPAKWDTLYQIEQTKSHTI